MSRRERGRIRLAVTISAIVAGVAAAALAAGGGSGARTSPPTSAEPAASPPPAQTANGPRPGRVIRFGVGRGAESAAIVRRAGTTGPQPVVIFLHGWGIVGPNAYRGWVRHLAARGNTVIVPRYQLDARADPGTVRAAAFAGIRRALRRAPAAPGSVVVAGHSAGAAIAADYAAVAQAARLPSPVAVFAVYPGRRILGYPAGIPEADPQRIPGETRLTVLAGSRDAVVGDAPARELVQRASAIPRERRRLVRIRGGAADHLAPLRRGRAARRAFWRRLDRLMERARG